MGGSCGCGLAEYPITTEEFFSKGIKSDGWGRSAQFPASLENGNQSDGKLASARNALTKVIWTFTSLT